MNGWLAGWWCVRVCVCVCVCVSRVSSTPYLTHFSTLNPHTHDPSDPADRHPMFNINAVPPPVVHADVQAIAAGISHSMILKQDGSVWATGKNKNGQLGDGTNTDRQIFVKVVSSGQCGTMVISLSVCMCVCVCVCVKP